MWIPYDLMGSLKPETSAATIERSKADRTVRDVIVGFFVRNPVTQTWEIDVKIDALDRVLAEPIDGMTAEIGATTYDEAEARTAIAMASNAQRVVVAVDGSKSGKVTLAKMVSPSQMHHLVTDSTADRDQLDRIAAAGVRVHVVEIGDE